MKKLISLIDTGTVIIKTYSCKGYFGETIYFNTINYKK